MNALAARVEHPGGKTVGQVFADQLAEARESMGMSQQDLSARLIELGVDMDRTAIARIETRRREILLNEALAIAKALGLSPIHLMLPKDADGSVVVVPDDKSWSPDRVYSWLAGWLPLEEGIQKDDLKGFLANSQLTGRDLIEHSALASTLPSFFLTLAMIPTALRRSGPVLEEMKELTVPLIEALQWLRDLPLEDIQKTNASLEAGLGRLTEEG